MAEEKIRYNDGGGHWYQPNGVPAYEVLKKDGKGMKRTTIREAKEMGLFPSVTGILDVLAKPALQNWIINEVLKAAESMRSTVIIEEGVTDIEEEKAEWKRQVMEQSKKISSKASKLGSKIHKIVEEVIDARFHKRPYQLEILLKEQELDVNQWADHFSKWCDDHNIHPTETEKSVSCKEFGYGGKLDYIGTFSDKSLVYIDWKTQYWKGNKAFYYPQWGCQLAGYAYCCGDLEKAKLISVCIDTNEPGRIDYFEWKDSEKWFHLFKLCLELWKSPLGKNWDPCEKA